MYGFLIIIIFTYNNNIFIQTYLRKLRRYVTEELNLIDI